MRVTGTNENIVACLAISRCAAVLDTQYGVYQTLKKLLRNLNDMK